MSVFVQRVPALLLLIPMAAIASADTQADALPYAVMILHHPDQSAALGRRPHTVRIDLEGDGEFNCTAKGFVRDDCDEANVTCADPFVIEMFGTMESGFERVSDARTRPGGQRFTDTGNVMIMCATTDLLLHLVDFRVDYVIRATGTADGRPMDTIQLFSLQVTPSGIFEAGNPLHFNDDCTVEVKHPWTDSMFAFESSDDVLLYYCDQDNFPEDGVVIPLNGTATSTIDSDVTDDAVYTLTAHATGGTMTIVEVLQALNLTVPEGPLTLGMARVPLQDAACSSAASASAVALVSVLMATVVQAVAGLV